MKLIDIWQSYGAIFYVRFKDGVRTSTHLRKLKSDWGITQIKPSLEDVLIKLVEGQDR